MKWKFALAIGLLFLWFGPTQGRILATLKNPQCYENVGCPHKDSISEEQARELSCENLWLVRNTIFHQRGYCFQSARGRAEFDNSRCSSNSIPELRLNFIERANVATLRKLERSKGCH
jgi:YARHG domain-containing protein